MMYFSLKRAMMGLGAIGSLACAVPAYAGCGEAAIKPSAWQGQEKGLFRPIAETQSIVGLWSVQFFVNGNMIDFGYSQWHSDGTEFLNSGGRAPSTQNYCLGVWVQNGSHYRLNHFALSYDPGGTLNAIINIKEDVVLTSNYDYSGPFTIDVYDPKSKALLQHIAGRVVGKRVTVNSGI